MTRREWKPGDVAVISTPSGETWFALVRERKSLNNALEFAYTTGSYDLVGDMAEGYTARPLVVIDPEDPGTMDALGKAWDEAESCDLDNVQPMTMRALRARIALRSLVADPKPDEPTGLGAVVEDSEGGKWTRWTDAEDYPDCWLSNTDGSGDTCYANITAVRVLSPGVTEDGAS